MRNDIVLYTDIDGEKVSHFKLNEFENHDGFAMVDPEMLRALEFTRKDLCDHFKHEVWIIITCCLRTNEENEELATRLGWTDEGGAVSRTSKHLTQFGGIAVDFVVVNSQTRNKIEPKLVGNYARKYFTFVKDDYGDSHIHADMREYL